MARRKNRRTRGRGRGGTRKSAKYYGGCVKGFTNCTKCDGVCTVEILDVGLNIWHCKKCDYYSTPFN